MRIICAWCGKVMVPGPDEYVEISHGICDECCKIELDKMKKREKVTTSIINT